MIILAGEANFQDEAKSILVNLGYAEEKHVVNFHAKGLSPGASQGDMIEWLINKPAAKIDDFIERMDKSPTSGHEWQARIANLNTATGGEWFIHDFRVIWFLDSFIQEAGDVKIIALISEVNDYHKAIGRFLEKRLVNGPPVLRLTKPPKHPQIKKFLKGETIK